MFKNYLKMAWKVLLRRKFFTFISLFGISFTLMVLVPDTAMIDSIISATPPESRIDNILFIKNIGLQGSTYSSFASPSYYFLNRYVRTLKSPAMVSIYSGNDLVSVYLNGRKIKLAAKYTDSNFWRILNFRFIEGRPFMHQEMENAAAVAVISEKTKTGICGSGSALGRTIELGRKQFRIIGVVGNVNKKRESYSDVWAPLTAADHEDFSEFNYIGGYQAMLLASGKGDIDKIKKEFNRVVSKAEIPQPEKYKKILCPLKNNIEWTADSEDLSDETKGLNLVQKLVLVSLLFIILPLLNLINLNVSRIIERAPEIAIRKSFGATSGSLVMQFLVENLVLTIIGSLLGLILGQAAIYAVNLSGLFELTMNFRIVIYYIIITIFFGILSGVLPAYKMSRLKPAEGLRGEIK
jgi:putative ABC transport system permease protein